MKIRRLWRNTFLRFYAVIRRTISSWLEHDASRMGAALAYYSIFSLGPLFLLGVSVAGFVFGEDAAHNELGRYLTTVFGSSAAEMLEKLSANAHQEKGGIIAAIAGGFFLILAATKVVMELKDALNHIWEVKSEKQRGMWPFLKKYVISIAAILGFGFLLLVSLVLTTLLSAFGRYVSSFLPFSKTTLTTINVVMSFAGITSFFALLFKYLPDVKVKWKDVWVGAVSTAVLFAIGKFAIGFYLGRQGLNSTFGAAASVVLVLLWIFYSAQILFFGAEFTRMYAKEFGALKSQNQTAT